MLLFVGGFSFFVNFFTCFEKENVLFLGCCWHQGLFFPWVFCFFGRRSLTEKNCSQVNKVC